MLAVVSLAPAALLDPLPLSFAKSVPVANVANAPVSVVSARASVASLLNTKVTPYDLTTKAGLTFNLGTGSYYANIEITKGVSYDTDKIKELLSGNVSLPRVNPVQALAAFYGLKTNHTSNYGTVRSQMYRTHGAENVYFVSERFSEWASPETVGTELAKAVATAGSSAASSVKEAFNQIKLELNDIYTWAKAKGQRDLPKFMASVLEGIVLRKNITLPGLSVRWINIDHFYKANVGVYGVGASPSVRSPHLGFAIVWKTPAGTYAKTLKNFSKLTSANVAGEVQSLLNRLATVPSIKNNKTLAKFVKLATANPSSAIDQQVTAKLKTAFGLDLALLKQKYVAGNPVIDLRNSPVGTRLKKLADNLTLGNEGSATVSKLEFNLGTLAFNVEVSLRHRHSWGSVAEILANIGKKVGEFADKFGNTVKQGLDSAGNVVRDIVQNSGETIKEWVDSAGAKISATYRNGVKILENIFIPPGVQPNLDRITQVLRDRFGDSASSAAQALREAGQSLSKIAQVLNANFPGISKNTIAGALRSAGASYQSIASAMKAGIAGIGNSDVAKAIYYGIGSATWANAADAMYNGIGGLSRASVAGILHSAGATYQNIAKGLREGIAGTTISQIADSIYRGIGVAKWANAADAIYKGLSGFTRNDVASALHSAGASYRAIATALRDGIVGTTASQIASAIQNGIGPATWGNAADAIYNGLMGFTRNALADVLHKAGASYASIGKALKDGIGATAAQTASAIYNGIQVSKWADVADGLYNGFSGLSRQSVAGVLYGTGAGYRSIARALKDGISGSSASQIASAIYNGIGPAKWKDVADALYSGFGGLNRRNIAGIMHGLNVSYDSIAYAIKNGIANTTNSLLAYVLYNGIEPATYADVAKAIHEGLDVSYETVASALSDGLQISASAVASAYRSIGGIASSVADRINSIIPSNPVTQVFTDPLGTIGSIFR